MLAAIKHIVDDYFVFQKQSADALCMHHTSTAVVWTRLPLSWSMPLQPHMVSEAMMRPDSFVVFGNK